MGRRLVFAGGNQARALARAYTAYSAANRHDDVFFVNTGSVTREAVHRVIAAADVLVVEATLGSETIPKLLIPEQAEVIKVPVVLGPFLWPFAGRPHPMNRGCETLPQGPYPADFGDSRLDALLADGLPADEAVGRYLASDIASEIDLDALLQQTLSEQASLDASIGFDLANFINDEFRRANLFASRERLHPPLFLRVAQGLFGRLGIDAQDAQGLLEEYIEPDAMPIHPAILRHFEIEQPRSDHRYALLNEGMFNFEEYCHRYVRYIWNEPLHTAMALAEIDPRESIPALRRALQDSPGSQAGHRALRHAEHAIDRSSENVMQPQSDVAGSCASLAGNPSQLQPKPWSITTVTVSDETSASAALHTTVFEAPFAHIRHGTSSYGDAGASPQCCPPASPDPPRLTLSAELWGPLEQSTSFQATLATMPESMPPPPFRPTLPPESRSDPARGGLMAKLLRRMR